MQVGSFDQLRDVSEGFSREICPLVQVPSSVFFARRANFGVASETGNLKGDGGEVAAGEAAGFEPDDTYLPSIARQRDSGPDAFLVFRVENHDKVAYGWIYVHFGFPFKNETPCINSSVRPSPVAESISCAIRTSI